MTYDINFDPQMLGSSPKVGFDIGRVLIQPGDGSADTSFLSGSDEDAMRTPPMKGAFGVVRDVTELVGGRAWLISKCGPKIQKRSLRWLRRHRFHEVTGLRPDRVVFCLKRSDKAVHCARLGLVAFVDDRPDVHRHLAGIVPLRILYGPQKPGARVPAGVLHALDWAEVRSILVPVLAGT
jgi:hypothetical protein